MSDGHATPDRVQRICPAGGGVCDCPDLGICELDASSNRVPCNNPICIHADHPADRSAHVIVHVDKNGCSWTDAIPNRVSTLLLPPGEHVVHVAECEWCKTWTPTPENPCVHCGRSVPHAEIPPSLAERKEAARLVAETMNCHATRNRVAVYFTADELHALTHASRLATQHIRKPEIRDSIAAKLAEASRRAHDV